MELQINSKPGHFELIATFGSHIDHFNKHDASALKKPVYIMQLV